MSYISQKGAVGPLSLQANGTFQTITDASTATVVGTRWDTADGRELILASLAANATAVVPGHLYQDSAIVANHQGLVVTAVQAYSANGNTPATVTVTLGGTAATANEYAGGFLVVKSGTGIGQTLRVSGNAAQTSGTGSCVITLEDGPNTALDTASVVSLIPPHAQSVIIAPTTLTGALAGISLYPVTASTTAGVSTYFYLVTKGLTAAVADTTAPTIGEAIGNSPNTAGTIAQVVEGSTILTSAVIGYAAQSATSADAGLVFVNL